MAEMKQVLSKLAERTEQNRIPWRKGEMSGTYEVTLGNLTLQIMGPGNGMEGANDTLFLYIKTKGHRGAPIGSAMYLSKEPDVNSELISVWENATRIAADDPRLDEVLEALDEVPPGA